MDKLDIIFNKQKELTDRVYSKYAGGYFNCFNFSEKEFKTWYALVCANQEISETIQKLNFKVWKAQKKNIDKKEILEELCDALHFLIQAVILLGFSADDFFKAYEKKNEINHQRQSSNY